MGMLLPTTPEHGTKKEQDADAASMSSRATVSDSNSSSDTTENSSSCIVKKWQQATDAVHKVIEYFVVSLSLLAASRPWQTITLITFVSFALVSIGFFTNFNVQVKPETVYAPFGNLPMQHKDWIDHESGFPESPRPLSAILHSNGNNVLGKDQVELLFEALDTIRGTPGYDEICQASTYRNSDGQPACKIFGATRFWDHEASNFHKAIDSDEAAVKALSAETYPGGVPVYTEFLFGYAEREGNVEDEGGSHQGELLTSAKSYLLRVNIPNTEGVEEFEMEMLDRLGALQDKWSKTPGNKLQLSYFTLLSYDMEFKRAIDTDLILVPFVVLIMSAFTCAVFYRSDRVQSRSLLALGSVAAVGLSLMSGYGLMFIIGVPFTSMTQLLPFIVFGVGLDDTFIIMGAYLRTDPSKATMERIEETMLEVGQSISLTTITTMSAFILGCISTIPAIQWVCIYAFPTIFINFVYQITIFVSFLVLDERRVKANRKDCCICITVEKDAEEVVSKRNEKFDQDVSEESERYDESPRPVVEIRTKSINERFMSWYATQLMRPWVKLVVFAVFIGYFGFCVYCTSNLTQQFRTQDFVPEDSYVSNFLESLDSFSEQVMGINVYFRGVNQSDPHVQGEMRRYMHDLMQMPAVNGTKPPFCWVMDFQERKDDPIFDLVKDLSFSEKVTLALNNPLIQEAYGDDIVQDKDGNIVTSRCWLNPKHLDLDVVREQIDLLANQRVVSLSQPVNSDGLNKLKFFTYDTLYFIWEFYTVAVDELIFTTISGMVAVCLVGFILIKHRSATAFVFPMILVLYVDLLGTLQFAGLYINVVTYVCLVISIGLLVDFLMHIILRYYESGGSSREQKVIETLETMGASILVGGLSTFLGVIPLAFSTSAILRTVFIAFFAMVTLGLAHGLILLPVVLSLWGPTICIHSHNNASKNTISIDDLELAKDYTKETMMGEASAILSRTSDMNSVSSLFIGSQTSDSQSVSSEAYSQSCATPTIQEEDETKRCEILRIKTAGDAVVTVKCTDVVEC